MPQSEPVAILLINEEAEEIKLVTLSLRGFFPGCRVEVAYSLDEALQWAPRASWHLILLDERLIEPGVTPALSELKRLAPPATLVLQTDRSDPTAALDTLQAGADFLLFKKSPAFLTELVLYARDALEKQALRGSLDRIKEHHSRLIEVLHDVWYELDAEGRFVSLSSHISTLLGYSPEELVGAHYSTVLPTDQIDRARHRFDDRRAGSRAAWQIELELVPKAQSDQPATARITAAISARGLYDLRQSYLGTVGLIHNVSHQRAQEATIHRLEHQLRETDQLVTTVRRFSTLSKNLQGALAAALAQTQQLLKDIRGVRLVEQVDSLMLHTAEAVRLGEEISDAMNQNAVQENTINDIIDAVFDAAPPLLLNTYGIERAYASNLPSFTKSRDALIRILRVLLLHALRYVATTGSRHRLRISTAAINTAGNRIEPGPTLFPPMIPSDVEIHIEETNMVAQEETPLPSETVDLFEAYALLTQLGGRLDFLAPAGGALSIKILIPLGPVPALPVRDEPAPPSVISTPPIQTLSLLSDRRLNDRLSVHYSACLTIGNTMRNGTVTTLGLGGMDLVVKGPLPSLLRQPAYVILNMGVGILELQAIAQDRGETPRLPGTEQLNSRLALCFIPLSDIEQNVLSSMINEAKTRTLPLTVEALLSLPDDTAGIRETFIQTKLRGTDHREAMRVHVAQTVHITVPSLSAVAHRPLGLVINFSRGGACLQVKDAPGSEDEVISLQFSATGPMGQPKTHEPQVPEAELSGRIIWIAKDHGVPSQLKPGPSKPGHRIGIRFVQQTPFAEREVNRVVSQHIGRSMDLEGIVGRSTIVSARRECRNARDQVIVVTDDHARHQISPNTPIVVIVPGFGQTQTDYLPLAFYLAANRFRVLRYDHTNHVGQSNGDVLQTTLRSMETDLQNVLEFVRLTWPTAPLTILANDVAARVALKVMAKNPTTDQLLLVNPVLDIGIALSTTYQQDVIEGHKPGLRRGVANLWGLNVNLDQFVGDLIAGEYADLSTTKADLAALVAPLIILTTPCTNRGAGSMFGSLGNSLRALGTPPVVVPLETDISGESLSYGERHISSLQKLLRQISSFKAGDRPSSQIHESTVQDIRRQQRLEKERIRIRHHVSQAAREALWVARLAQLPQLGNLPDHWTLMAELYRRLLPLEPGMTVLDIGCGAGDFARVLLTNQAYRLAHQPRSIGPPLHYIGLSRSDETLKKAELHVQTFVRELAIPLTAIGSPTQLVETKWVRFDWDSPLPFNELAIDRILYNLSLPFAPSPLQCLRHAFRVLHPEGLIVVTCFQPHTDLSTLFRSHALATGQDEFTAPVQIVLHYLGRLREAIRHGLIHSYERSDLARLLIHAGAQPPQIFPVLEGHLLLAIAQKSKATG